MGKNRIAYVDMAKGFCMILVVMIHTGIPEIIPHIYASKVALFFVLSGFFYHDENMSVHAFVVRKCKQILYPFVFFYIVSYFVFYLMIWIEPSLSKLTEAKGLLDCFTQKNYFDGPLWFLLSLFEIQMLVFFCRRIITNIQFRIIFYIVSFVGGYLLAIKEIDLPLNIDTTLTFLIFFAIGNFVYKNGLLEKIGKIKCFFFSICGYLVFCVFPVGCYASVNRYVCDNAIELLLMLVILCFSVLLLCKAFMVKKLCILKIFPYIGRHTMWILCSHHLLYRPIKIVISKILGYSNTQIEVNIVVFAITMVLCVFTASYVEKKIPWALGKA